MEERISTKKLPSKIKLYVCIAYISAEISRFLKNKKKIKDNIIEVKDCGSTEFHTLDTAVNDVLTHDSRKWTSIQQIYFVNGLFAENLMGVHGQWTTEKGWAIFEHRVADSTSLPLILRDKLQGSGLFHNEKPYASSSKTGQYLPPSQSRELTKATKIGSLFCGRIVELKSKMSSFLHKLFGRRTKQNEE